MKDREYSTRDVDRMLNGNANAVVASAFSDYADEELQVNPVDSGLVVYHRYAPCHRAHEEVHGYEPVAFNNIQKRLGKEHHA